MRVYGQRRKNLQRLRLLRRGLLLLLLAGAAGACLPACRRLFAEKPNVILITVDACRPDHFGCYGYGRDTSPAIDRIASEGFLFTGAVAASTWTSPSVASLMSSTDPLLHGVSAIDKSIPLQLPLLAEILSRAGYRTAAFVNQAGLDVAGQGFDRGFDVYRAQYARACTPETQHLGDAALTDDAREWLRAHRGDPFFLWVHYMNPHSPYTPPPPYATLFSRDRSCRTGKRAPVGDSYCFGHIPRKSAPVSLETRDVDTYVRRYDGEIRCVDDQIRRLREVLKESGALDRSVFIITADHGESLGENNWYFEHAMAFETILKVPLIIRLPARTAPPRSDALVSLLDVAPTVLDILGLRAPASFEGKSLLPLMRGETRAVREYAFGTSRMLGQRYLRTLREKFVVSRPPADFREQECHRDYLREKFGTADEAEALFDLVDDPHEERNLARERPAEAAAQRARLDEHARREEAAARLLPAPAKGLIIEGARRDLLRSLGYLK